MVVSYTLLLYSRFPTIASLTRDILTILVTSIGIERLFNTTRDIYYYHRGRIKTETIKELMLFLYILRFNLKLHKAKELKRFFSLNKIEALREEKDDKLNNIEFE
ncbi:HAT dimerisation [Penicillium camemberti]|uniref:HAT dimerisation n=1 Tax=Penicillium camemberti (strain FM 013) TaxID=1429867 RepID=A0A0G4PXW9_PENC3|nr:HAT dimerisation [Penicillium camemberti]